MPFAEKQMQRALPRPKRGRRLKRLHMTIRRHAGGKPMIATRRQFIRGAALGAATLAAPGAFAQALATAITGDGPYYPDRLPLDTDNDLLILNDKLTPAVGEIAHFSGRLFAENGSPVRNAFIEIWQSDSNGSYIHTQGRNDGKLDANFQ